MKRISSLVAAAAVAWSLVAAPAQASNSFPAVGHGDAYAALAALDAGGVSKALAILGCNVQSATNKNSALSIAFGGALSTGTATDTVVSMHSSSGAAMQSTSVVQGVNALGSLITATTVEAEATSSAAAAGASSDGKGSTFVNLIVAGVPINAHPAPNTIIALPGIGSVELNEQILTNDASTTSIIVNMIHIRVTTANSLGLKIGTNIIVAHALSRLTVAASPTNVDASAYGLLYRAKADDISISGDPYALATIACVPGRVRNRIASISSPLGSTGAVVDTADGVVTTAGGMATGTSTIANADLLGGVISAGSIESVAQAQVTTTGARSGSTTLVNAKVGGVSLSAHPAPNTRINIAGLGYAIINEQTGATNGTSASEQVSAIHLFVTVKNVFNLPINSTIIIGHSQADAIAF
jgi:hypothetical protein